MSKRRRPSKKRGVSEPIDRVVEIERLATLDPIDYEAGRIEAAMRLKVRASVLDREVTKKRCALGLETNDTHGQGRAVKIVDVLPWHEPVDGDRIATMLAAAVKIYLVVSDAAADTIALWTLHTWTVNAFTITPRLAITSPTKGCGKTTALRLLNHITRRPKRSGSISPAALFRMIEKFQPTVLLDETEKYIENGSDVHALLNEGHCKGGTVTRVLGEGLELREFPVFGAVAFARNGRLPDDLQQRSVIIEMQRRRAHEELAHLRDDRAELLQQIARMCARWAYDYGHLLADQDPDMGAVINRVADNWRPLFAIADLINEGWPERIREAAAILVPRESESIGPMLLADIKAVFDEKQTDRLASTDMCEALIAVEGRPWADWKGKPLSANQLARLLRPFGITTNTTIRVGIKTAKGYHRHQFEEAWERYLPSEGVNERSHGNSADEIRAFNTFQSVTPKGNVTDQKCEKPLADGDCDCVTVQKGDGALNGEVWPPTSQSTTDEDRSCRQCDGTLDGTDQLYEIDGTRVWLHPECRRFFIMKAGYERPEI